MPKLTKFLLGMQILEEIESPVNGKLTVVRDLAWGTHILGGGVTQSGGVMRTVWRTTLKAVAREKNDVSRALIFGLGGGDAAKLIAKSWPGTRTLGIDIDPVIVDLGKKYLSLSDETSEIIIADAMKESKRLVNGSERYDLILTDTYVQTEFPIQFEQNDYLERVRALLAPDGIAIFNRFYGGSDRDKAHAFEAKLMNVFPSVERIYPEANIMFICSLINRKGRN